MPDAPWTPERVVSSGLARRLVERHRPDLADATVEELPAGWDNTVFCFGGRWIARFPRRQIAVELLARECEMLPWLAPHLSLPVPVPDFVGEPSEDFPWPYSGYEMLPGTTGCRRAPDDAARMRAAPVLARFLRELHNLDPTPHHSLPADPLRKLDPDRYRDPIESTLRDLEARGLGPAPQLLLPIVEAAPRSPPCPLAITHGDLYSRHLLFDSSAALTGVIDWGDLQRNDPALDLSVAFAFFPIAARERFEDSYGRIAGETRDRARLRALASSVLGARFALGTSDDDLLRESCASLFRLLET